MGDSPGALDLTATSVSDLHPLSNLTSLTILQVVNSSNISDLSPLTKLTSLTVLWLEGSSISDLTPLSGLTSLAVAPNLAGRLVATDDPEMQVWRRRPSGRMKRLA